MSKSDSKSDFTHGSILGKLLPFMVPILGALVLQAAYGAVDLLVVGRFGTTSGLSAVSTGSQVLNLVTFVITQFAMGITVLIARYIGENKKQHIGPLIGGSTIIYAIISVVLFVIMIGFSRQIAVLMQAPQEAVDLTSVYVRICGGGIFFIVAYNLLAAIFRGLGDSKSPLIFVAVACVVNIVGDLVLVAGFKMDAAGAAIATVAAQAVSVVFAIVLLVKKQLVKITGDDFKVNEHCVRALKVGAPLALQECLTQISFLALCAFVNRLGLTASSGYGVACKIVNFAMLVPSSLMQSMASFVSQNVGAGKEKRAKKAMFTGMGVGLVVGCMVFSFVMFKGDLLTGIFTTDTAVIQKGYDYLRFSHMTVTTAEHHDAMIAYTSQMCHVLSNAYVKSPRAQMHKGYSAGSYRDLTRVAWLNETMWTDLFLENRDYLLEELDRMIGYLGEYRDALEQGNGDRLCTLLAEGRICKEKVDAE